MFFYRSGSEGVLTALHTSLAVIEFAPNGDILSANDNFLRVAGYSASELKGRHHKIFCDPQYVSSNAYRQFWHELAAGKFKAGEVKRFGKSGETVWMQATYTPVLDRLGRVVKVVKIASDITNQKTIAIDHAGKVEAIGKSQAVIEFSTSGIVLDANENFLKCLGYERHEIVGQHHRLFCDGAYSNTRQYETFWLDLSKGEYQTGEFKRLGKGGREVYIQASYSPILDDTGTVVKIVKYATDITQTVERRLRNEGLSQDIHSELGSVVSQMVDATKVTEAASSSSSETGSLVNSVAAASEELSASVSEIAQSMTFAKTSVENVFEHASAAARLAATLNRSAEAMNNIVSIIQSIASQINLLALNATIESARAGEAGRGFAVVATEVKSLANEAARSTKTIAEEISNMQTVSIEVSDTLQLISNNMTSVLENVASVASAIEEQHAVSGEISANMQSAVVGVRTVEDALAHITSLFSTVANAQDHVKNSVEKLVA